MRSCAKKLVALFTLSATPLLSGCVPYTSFTTGEGKDKIVHYCTPITPLVTQENAKNVMNKFFGRMRDAAAQQLETDVSHITFTEGLTQKDAYRELSSEESWYCYKFWSTSGS